jgi:hypothetical protein
MLEEVVYRFLKSLIDQNLIMIILNLIVILKVTVRFKKTQGKL